MTFSDLQLIEPVLRAVTAEGYDTPTPIQRKAIPHLLAGRDLIGIAQTGTGKTAAFALPILQRLSQSRPPSGARPTRALVLTPTRELASQIGDSFAAYGRHLHLRHTVIFGGVGQEPQSRALRAGVDVLVATPGRLLDLMGQKLARFDSLEVLVLDEADRMLDMGFIHDVRRVIAALPTRRQTLLFSATMPEDIRALAASVLRDPVRVEAAPQATTAERVEQSVYFVDKSHKRALLEHLLRDGHGDRAIRRALVFTRTKHGANRLAEQLDRSGFAAAAIHGNKSQGARERALDGFKRGTLRVLVATDIAARGIDIDDLDTVVNYELPNIPESYVHRIGRTARAGAAGFAIALCDKDERAFLTDIERLIGARVPVVATHPFASLAPVPSTELRADRPLRQRDDNRGRGNRNRAAQPKRKQEQPRPQRRRAPSVDQVLGFLKRS